MVKTPVKASEESKMCTQNVLWHWRTAAQFTHHYRLAPLSVAEG